MIKANSLLYAIYICLIVAVLCAAMLYMSGLYNRLNQYYVSRQDMYIHNQSLVNFAMAHIDDQMTLPDADDSGIESLFEIKQYGVIPLVIARSVIGQDTIASAHFAGSIPNDKTALYVPDYGGEISYSGNVKLQGDSYLPGGHIGSSYLSGLPNELDNLGTMHVSKNVLPKLAKSLESGASRLDDNNISLVDVQKERVFSNSFLKPTVVLGNVNRIEVLNIRGNVIIKSADSIVISAGAKLEDVVLMAPKIIFEDNFEGSVQAFATSRISVGKNVKLSYPSVLYVSANNFAESEIKVNDGAKIYGIIVLYGNEYQRVDHNNIFIGADVKAYCDIYSTGNISLGSDVLGAVYSNRVSYKTPLSFTNNCIINVAIGPGKRPGYFLNIPLFKARTYEAVKKVI